MIIITNEYVVNTDHISHITRCDDAGKPSIVLHSGKKNSIYHYKTTEIRDKEWNQIVDAIQKAQNETCLDT